MRRWALLSFLLRQTLVEPEAKHPPLALVVSLGAVEDRVPLNGEALHARHDGGYYVILLHPFPSPTYPSSASSVALVPVHLLCRDATHPRRTTNS